MKHAPWRPHARIHQHQAIGNSSYEKSAKRQLDFAVFIDELLMLRFQSTRAGDELWVQYLKALRDAQFQAFKAKAMPVAKKPGRRSVAR